LSFLLFVQKVSVDGLEVLLDDAKTAPEIFKCVEEVFKNWYIDVPTGAMTVGVGFRH